MSSKKGTAKHARVYHPDTQRWTPVKNLGWLLRHWKEVESIELWQLSPTHSYNEALMRANLRGGVIYETEWSSAAHARWWLARPVFIGVKLWMFNHWTEVKRR